LEKDLLRDQEPWNTYAGEAYVAKPGARRTPLDGGMEKYTYIDYTTLLERYTRKIKKFFIFFVFFLTLTAKSPIATPDSVPYAGRAYAVLGFPQVRNL
jgi:hypothetical protein